MVFQELQTFSGRLLAIVHLRVGEEACEIVNPRARVEVGPPFSVRIRPFAVMK